MAKNYRRMGLVAAASCLALALSACGGSGGSGGSDEDTIKVGILTDLSSIFSIYGIPNARGVELGFEYATDGSMEVDGKKIEIVQRDGQNNPETGASAARELIEREGVDVIMGTMSSGVTQAVMELVDGKDVIYMPVSSAEEVTGDWFTENTFRISRNIQIDANAMVEYVGKKDPDAKWVVLAPNYALGQSATRALHDAVKGTKQSFVSNPDVYAPPETTDFTPYLEKIKNSGADYLANFWVADQTALYQQMRDMGVEDDMTSIGVLANDPVIPDVYPIGALGTTPYRFDLIDTPANNWFVEKYEEKYDEPPNVISGPAFSSAVAYVAALKAADGDTAAKAMIPALEKTPFESVYGSDTRFRACDHAGLIPYYVAQVDNLDDPDHHYLKLERELTPEEAAVPCQVEGRK